MTAHVFRTSKQRNGISYSVCVNCRQGFHPEIRWIKPCQAA